MKGETVRVRTFTDGEPDPFGSPVRSEVVSTVENVLVQPGASNDVSESNRPDGVLVRYTLHFPKTFSGDLEGAEVEVRGEWLEVIGSPKPYTMENTPTQWWLPAEVKRTDG